LLQRLGEERKHAKPHHDMVDGVVRSWNELRERATPKARKVELVGSIVKALAGRVMAVILRHDASRVVQGCLKHGTQAQRDALCGEMSSHVLELTKAKHGHQLMEKMLRYGGPAVRTQVHKALKGHMVRLMTHNLGAMVVETGFNRCWTGEQCWDLYQELYGQSFIHFKAAVPATARNLGAVLAAHPDKRKGVLESIYYTLSKQIDKGLMSTTCAQKLLCEYLTYAQPEQIVSVVGAVKEQLLACVSTREGARAAALCFAYATPKERKAMLKALKGHMLDLATHDHGHMTLIAALAVTDDTRATCEAVLDELKPHLPFLAHHRFGRKVLLYILAGPAARYFPPTDTDVLNPVVLPAYLVNRKPPTPAPATAAPTPAAGAASGASGAEGGASKGDSDGKPAAAKGGEEAGAAAAPAAGGLVIKFPGGPDEATRGDAAKMAPTPTYKKPQHVKRNELLTYLRADLESAMLTHTALLARSVHGAGVLCEAAAALRSPELNHAIAALVLSETPAEEQAAQLAAMRAAAATAGSSLAQAGVGTSKLTAALAAGGVGSAAAAAGAGREEGGEDGAAGKEEEEEDDDEDDEEEDDEEEEGGGDGDDAMGGGGEARLPILEHPPSHLLFKWLLAREADAAARDAVVPRKHVAEKRGGGSGAAEGSAPPPPAPAEFGPALYAAVKGTLVSLAGSNRGCIVLTELLFSRDGPTALAVRNELIKASAELAALSFSPDFGLTQLRTAVAALTAPAPAGGAGTGASGKKGGKASAAATPSGKRR